jgi:hypothetical protein
MLAECMCDCMGKSTTYKCADKRRYTFNAMLALFKKARSQWHRDDKDGACTCGCNQADITAWCSTPDSSLRNSMCAEEVVPEFGLPEYDLKTAMPTGETTVVKMHRLSCHEGTCADCGWSNVFGGCPLIPLVDSVSTELRLCAVDSSAQPFSWYSFQRIPNAPPPTINDDDDPDFVGPGTAKATYNIYWFPVTGTRAQFMLELHTAFCEYREHMYWVGWHRLHYKRAVDRFITQPAVLGSENVPQWQRNHVISHTDFAATIKLARSAEATGAFSQTSQMLVSVVTHDPRLLVVADLDAGTFRSRQVRTYSDTLAPTGQSTSCCSSWHCLHDNSRLLRASPV